MDDPLLAKTNKLTKVHLYYKTFKIKVKNETRADLDMSG